MTRTWHLQRQNINKEHLFGLKNLFCTILIRQNNFLYKVWRVDWELIKCVKGFKNSNLSIERFLNNRTSKENCHNRRRHEKFSKHKGRKAIKHWNIFRIEEQKTENMSKRGQAVSLQVILSFNFWQIFYCHSKIYFLNMLALGLLYRYKYSETVIFLIKKTCHIF